MTLRKNTHRARLKKPINILHDVTICQGDVWFRLALVPPEELCAMRKHNPKPGMPAYAALLNENVLLIHPPTAETRECETIGSVYVRQ